MEEIFLKLKDQNLENLVEIRDKIEKFIKDKQIISCGECRKQFFYKDHFNYDILDEDGDLVDVEGKLEYCSMFCIQNEFKKLKKFKYPQYKNNKINIYKYITSIEN